MKKFNESENSCKGFNPINCATRLSHFHRPTTEMLVVEEEESVPWLPKHLRKRKYTMTNAFMLASLVIVNMIVGCVVYVVHDDNMIIHDNKMPTKLTKLCSLSLLEVKCPFYKDVPLLERYPPLSLKEFAMVCLRFVFIGGLVRMGFPHLREHVKQFASDWTTFARQTFNRQALQGTFNSICFSTFAFIKSQHGFCLKNNIYSKLLNYMFYPAYLFLVLVFKVIDNKKKIN